MSDVRDTWLRIGEWFEANRRGFRGDMSMAADWASGATEEEIDSAERTLGVRFPKEMRDTYLFSKWHTKEYLVEGCLMALSEIVERWNGLNSVLDVGPMPQRGDDITKDPIQPVWWNPKWVQFIDASCDGACIDFDPLPGGTVGQIIFRDHEIGPTHVIAPSFREWLEGYADALERGEYFLDEVGRLKRR